MPQITYPALTVLLNRRLAVIGDAGLRENSPDEQLSQLKEISENIAALHEKMRETGIHPQLDHFLKNASFDKALAFVEKPQ